MSNAEAYRRAVDKPEMKPEVAASMADKWGMCNAKIRGAAKRS